jgi:hypothetical protein
MSRQICMGQSDLAAKIPAIKVTVQLVRALSYIEKAHDQLVLMDKNNIIDQRDIQEIAVFAARIVELKEMVGNGAK